MTFLVIIFLTFFGGDLFPFSFEVITLILANIMSTRYLLYNPRRIIYIPMSFLKEEKLEKQSYKAESF